MASSSLRGMFLFGIAGLVATAADGQMSKCTDAAGKVTYQQKPCEAGSTQKSRNVESAPAPSPTARAAISPPMGENFPENASKAEQMVFAMLYIKIECDAAVPGFAVRTASDFDRFRRQHEETVRKVESGRDWQAAQDAIKRRGLIVNKDPAIAAAVKQRCENGFDNLAANSAPADPRMRSLELAWQSFLSALRDGNHHAAAQFLTGRATQSLGEALPKMPAEAMRSMADSFTGFQIDFKADDMASVFVSRKSATGTRVGSIEFRKMGPNWKISGM